MRSNTVNGLQNHLPPFTNFQLNSRKATQLVCRKALIKEENTSRMDIEERAEYFIFFSPLSSPNLPVRKKEIFIV